MHTFLYRLLLDRVSEYDPEASAKQELAGLFQVAFGTGVQLDGAPKYDGRYDGSSAVDIQTLLCLYFLDGFDISEAAARESELGREPALPGAADLLDDILLFLLAYREHMPPLELTRALMALIAFGLFVYTARLHRATNELIATGALSPDMSPSHDGRGEVEIYTDFARERPGRSDELARACAERDLEELRHYVASSMRLRTIDRFVELRPDITNWLKDHPTPLALQYLHELADDPRVQARAENEIDQIKFESVRTAGTRTTSPSRLQSPTRSNAIPAMRSVPLLIS